MADKKEEATAGIEEKVIRLRPHHVQRVLYNWPFVDMNKFIEAYNNSGYDEHTIMFCIAIYRSIVEENSSFKVVRALDDICATCSGDNKPHPNCSIMLPEDKSYTLRYNGGQNKWGYAPSLVIGKVYIPFEVIGQHIVPGLEEAYSEIRKKSPNSMISRDILKRFAQYYLRKIDCYRQIHEKLKQKGGTHGRP